VATSANQRSCAVLAATDKAQDDAARRQRWNAASLGVRIRVRTDASGLVQVAEIAGHGDQVAGEVVGLRQRIDCWISIHPDGVVIRADRFLIRRALPLPTHDLWLVQYVAKSQHTTGVPARAE